jgi:uncharacterized repeat protein (TIGR01451 family)
MHRRLLPFSAIVLAIAFVVLLSRPGSSAAVPIAEPDSSPQRLTTSSITTITTDTITIPTYPYAAYLYTATNATYNIPYQWLHWAQYQGSNPHPINQVYTRLTLENQWLRVSLLPELGGRVYELIFKLTGNNELYRNTVIKPTHWGPSDQGWWLAAGGLEWGLPVEEHGYESAIPWLYDVTTGVDGITVTLRDSLQPDRLRAAIAVFLPNDRAVLIVRPRIENDRNVDLNFKWWDNALLAPGPGNSVGKAGANPNHIDLKFIYPETQVTVHSTGDPALPHEGWAMPWPIYNTRDMSRLQNWNQWLGFFARPSASSDFVSVYDQWNKEGVVRVFPHTVATGSKGFGMGWWNPIGAGEWTDDDSYYVELHGGLAPTFWDSAFLGAHQVIEWEETWYPVGDLDTITTANAEAALNVTQTGTQLNIGAYTTRWRDHVRLSVFRRSTCERLGEFSFDDLAAAGAPLRYVIPTTLPTDDITVLFTQNDQTLIGYNVPIDGTPPVVHMSALTNYVTQPTFSVGWMGLDNSCVRSFDVQVKDDLYGLWTDWLTGTMTTTHTFTGTHGHTYFFRTRARDLAGNQSTYSNDPLGDTSTTVLLTPAAVMELSNKVVPRFFSQGQGISYRVELRNTGNVNGYISLTDTLPLSMGLISGTLSASAGPAPQFDGAGISWQGSVTDAQVISITYALTPTIELLHGTGVMNTVVIEGGVFPVTRTAITTLAFNVYLPIILRNAP